MSELTSCNYCTLRAIEARAKLRGLQVTGMGQHVYVHPSGVEKDQLKPDGEYHVAWFMELTESCCC